MRVSSGSFTAYGCNCGWKCLDLSRSLGLGAEIKFGRLPIGWWMRSVCGLLRIHAVTTDVAPPYLKAEPTKSDLDLQHRHRSSPKNHFWRRCKSGESREKGRRSEWKEGVKWGNHLHYSCRHSPILSLESAPPKKAIFCEGKTVPFRRVLEFSQDTRPHPVDSAANRRVANCALIKGKAFCLLLP